MRAIIAGGRDFVPGPQHRAWLNYLAIEYEITTIISGGETGTDRFGSTWAQQRGTKVHEYPADWARYGRAACFRRNGEMARNADLCILFPGGSGTADMLQQARANGLKIEIWNYEPDKITQQLLFSDIKNEPLTDFERESP